eukprot:1679573-Pleurochrysis_carterae.AAC.1
MKAFRLLARARCKQRVGCGLSRSASGGRWGLRTWVGRGSAIRNSTCRGRSGAKREQAEVQLGTKLDR